MCLGPAPLPPTQKAATYQKLIVVMMVLLLITSVLNIISYQILAAVFGILLIGVLFLARRQMNFQLIMITIFFSLYFAILFLVEFLTPLQREDEISEYDRDQMFRFISYIIGFAVFSFVAIVLFFPYREFKGIAFDQDPALQAHFNSLKNNENQDNAGNTDRKKPENQMMDTYKVDYGDFQYEDKKKNNDKGTFKVFQGQGVMIG